MPGKSSKTVSSTSSKTAAKSTSGETRDSSSTYSYDPKKDNAQIRKDNEDMIKRLQQIYGLEFMGAHGRAKWPLRVRNDVGCRAGIL
ncbi:hypothetical protein FHL15_005815 [Xylaria flabelliformis]|uniref:Uncharacterized protein n=1 Tax=Xylaria flabelliformis TaxID=2512241 RepID=A0A553HZ50_9PEZI|nr:hypothetical protein FHL15_005815 [Xylaria flabelliformis]